MKGQQEEFCFVSLQVRTVKDGEGSTCQPITEGEERGLSDLVNNNREGELIS